GSPEPIAARCLLGRSGCLLQLSRCERDCGRYQGKREGEQGVREGGTGVREGMRSKLGTWSTTREWVGRIVTDLEQGREYVLVEDPANISDHRLNISKSSG